jgi:hypothetical protein
MRWTATDLDGRDFEKSHVAGSDKETVTPTIHLTLQGKGGVGKSLVASILAQYFRHRNAEIHCLDTDPVNQTLSQYTELRAEHLLDSHGNAGLRDQVDRHYRRLVGFPILTSLFTAAFEVSQRSTQSALTYPTPAQTAAAAVRQELSQTGPQITRRNLNVQPTIKIPAGYKFIVRVNRDILFEDPYEPIQPGAPIQVKGVLSRGTGGRN